MHPLGEQISLQFSLTKKYAYFNTAATGLVPKTVAETMMKYWQQGAYPYGLEVEELVQDPNITRAKMAAFIGAKEHEVAFVTNTAQAMSLAAACLPLARGDEVLIPKREFPAVVYPFLHGARTRGFDVRMLEWKQYGPTADEIEQSITERTRLVCLSWVQYLNGYTNDLVAIGNICKRHGITLAVDAIQGLGSIPLDVKKAGIDILGAGSFKWLMAGTGIATLYVSEDILPNLNPVLFNYRGNMSDVEDPEYKLIYHQDIRKFDLGTDNQAGMIALGASLDFIQGIGIDRIHAHSRALAHRIRQALLEQGYTLNTRENEVSPIVAFSCGSGEEDERLLAKLKEQNIWTCIRGLGIRIAPHLYCTEEDVERLLSACKR